MGFTRYRFEAGNDETRESLGKFGVPHFNVDCLLKYISSY